MLDSLSRPLHDLRISITDRCNFRCVYCMPREVFGRDFAFMDRAELLTFEEIERIARLFVAAGVEKIRLTGGEPLLRRDVEKLIAMLAGIDGLRDLALTTNGVLLTREKAKALAEAGLKRITISLDAIDDATFRRVTDASFGAADVLRAIDNAAAAGLAPVKIDAVLKRGLNEREILPLAKQFRGTGHIVRFIEFMDVGSSNRWRMDEVVPGSEVLETISREWPLEPIAPAYAGEVAERWRYADGAGEIGVITSVTRPFCGACTRARLSADGELFTCLFASSGRDLRALVRSGADDDAIRNVITSVWRTRDDRYSELRADLPSSRKVEMWHIGG